MERAIILGKQGDLVCGFRQHWVFNAVVAKGDDVSSRGVAMAFWSIPENLKAVV